MADEKIAEERTEPQSADAGERTDGRTTGRRRARRRSAKRAERSAAETAQSETPGAGTGEKAAEKPSGKPVGRAEEKPVAAAGKTGTQTGSTRAAKAAAKSARTVQERRTGRGGAGASTAKRASGPAAAGGGRKWRDDLRQLAVVVIGVALTIGIPEWIDRIGQRREERQVMWQVYEELQGNRAQIARFDEAIRFDGCGMRQSRSHRTDVDAFPADSLAGCMDIFRSTSWPMIRTDALETLRSSAAAASRCDKALLRDIYFCYGSIRSREERMAGCARSDDAATLDAQIGRTLAAIDEKYGFER